ncbi:MAG TPA: hypothetical protein VE378_06165 [Nitrososphaeraceae archaeon]|jgi:hypothetical protein|nr:hypothetical protein [Nitrososphaeraceae archaeon]
MTDSNEKQEKKNTKNNYNLNHHPHKKQKLTLKILVLAIIVSAIFANSITILSDQDNRPSTSLWILNITAAIASSLGIIAIYRHGLHGTHGKSYLFLTLGLISWFSADAAELYYHDIEGHKEQKFVSISDWLWFAGYGFLSAHLFTIIGSLRGSIRLKVIFLVAITSVIFVGYNIHILLSSAEMYWGKDVDFLALVVTVTYPMLDLILIVPSGIILISLRKDYQHSVPWFLASLSLLINAVADDGYVHDFVNGNTQNLWVWNMFYVTDFIIMAGALFWYNRFHIAEELSRKKIIAK